MIAFVDAPLAEYFWYYYPLMVLAVLIYGFIQIRKSWRKPKDVIAPIKLPDYNFKAKRHKNSSWLEPKPVITLKDINECAKLLKGEGSFVEPLNPLPPHRPLAGIAAKEKAMDRQPDEFMTRQRPLPNVKDSNPKDAIGCKKPSLSVLPGPVLYEIAAGLLEGACKYRRHNYREAGIRASIYFDAAMRHLWAYWEGEDIDPDSGMHHISKTLACLMVMRDAMLIDNCLDDRPPRPVKGWMDTAKKEAAEILARYPKPLPPYTELKLFEEQLLEQEAAVREPDRDTVDLDERPPVLPPDVTT